LITSTTSLGSNQARQIQINANNVTLDCKNKHITYPAASAVDRPLNCHNGDAAASCAVRITNRSNVVIKNCNIDAGAWGVGIWVDSSSGVTLQNTVVTGTRMNVRVSGSTAISLSGVHSSMVSTASGGSGEGFTIRRSQGVNVSGSESFGNMRDGFDVNGCRECSFSANAFNNGQNGIELDPSPSPTLYPLFETNVIASVVENNGNNGISLDGPVDCSVRDSIMADSDDNGLRIENTTDGGAFTNNTEVASGGFGLGLDAASDFWNVFSGNSFNSGSCLITSSCNCNNRSDADCDSP
jgi:hypothetical protein